MASQTGRGEYEGLSKRAIEILHLLAEGMSDRAIAERLVMTVNTVKWYNRQIYTILDVGSRTKAIARARELHLLNQGSGTGQSFPHVPNTAKHNLPVESTRFIGRNHEIDAVKRLLTTTRLLTLVGPPGTGKTRLAVRVAHELVEVFREGIFFVSLAPISDPALVANAIAASIGVNETQSQALLATLRRVLRDKQLLLVLDNFEHLLPGATQVSELLAAAPRLTVLATSREPLHLYGEQEYPVPPLALPDPEQLEPQALEECESIALFIERARAMKSDFEIGSANALDIAKICVRLDGLPLAIELAAAQIKLLSPGGLLARLERGLGSLRGGARDLPARQQTLRNTIDWSYRLLNDGEKVLFGRLGAFQGGRSLEAIEAVCAEELPVDVFEGLASLVDKSLIQKGESPGGEPRFVMLETLHEYARERLDESGEPSAIHRRHAEYFLNLAQHAEPELRRASFSHWMERLEVEDNNLRVALEWSFGKGDIELGMRLVACLRDYWVMSGRFIEAESWTRRALLESGSVSPGLRAGVLTAAGLVLYHLSQRTLQKQLLEEAVGLAREAGDRMNLAWALVFLGSAFVGQPSGYEEGLSAAEEGLSLFRELGHKPGMAQGLNIIGELRRTHNDDEGARAAYEECMLLVGETGEVRREAMILCNLGYLAMHRADVDEADQLFRKALLTSLDQRYDTYRLLSNIVLLAGAIAARGDLPRAARLFGAVDALLERMGVGLQPGDQPEHERDLAYVRSKLDEASLLAYWKEGRAWSLEQAIATALES